MAAFAEPTFGDPAKAPGQMLDMAKKAMEGATGAMGNAKNVVKDIGEKVMKMGTDIIGSMGKPRA